MKFIAIPLAWSATLLLGINQLQHNTSIIKEKTQATKPIMQDNSFTSTITVNKPATAAFNAIMNFRGWWSEEIDGNTHVLNETFFYHYKEIHLCKMKLIEMVPDKKLVYLITENEFNFVDDKTEWVNTKLIFDISNDGTRTQVKFTHEGLVPAYACYKVCYDAWSGYINNSLKNFIDTGIGTPNPKGEEGFNAALAKKWGLK